MTYKELYEAIKPFATDKVYGDEEVVVVFSTPAEVHRLGILEVDDDGQLEVGN
jgi:hypothetical protein